MTIHVFVGPTLPRDEVLTRLPGAVVHGPAKFGDVYRSARESPAAIALIDGYFERVPATWHKEILWAMSQGVHVFGASSMGALRAAELCDFGMVGVGAIFEAFRNGELEDDDEVAVAHADETSSFASASEAMVNVRATLREATKAGCLRAATAGTLTRLAKESFYAERSYPALLRAGGAAGLDPLELERLRAWLVEGRLDQKRADAERLLRELCAWQSSNPARKRVDYHFEATDAWREAERVASEGLSRPGSGQGRLDALVLEELKISGNYAEAHAPAVARGWALDAARRANVRPDAQAVRSAVETFRRDSGLTERRAFERWREEQDLDERALVRFFEERARASWAEPLSDAFGLEQLLGQLQSTGQYSALKERARLKNERLRELGLSAPSLSEVNLSEAQLWEWYFSERLKQPSPNDLEVFARASGFSSVEELRRAALRDYCFERQAPQPAARRSA